MMLAVTFSCLDPQIEPGEKRKMNMKFISMRLAGNMNTIMITPPDINLKPVFCWAHI